MVVPRPGRQRFEWRTDTGVPARRPAATFTSASGEIRLYETNVTRVYLLRQEGAAPPPEGREALLEGLRAASAGGPVAVVLDLGERPSVDPGSAAWWLGVLEDRSADVAVLAVVTRARSLLLGTLAFSAMVSLRHLPVEVKAHADEHTAIDWAAAALARAAAERRRAGQG